LLLVIVAIGLIINYIGFATGIHYTSPGNAQIFIQTGPILLTIIGVLIYKERLSLRQILGFLFAGIGFLFFYHEQLANLLGSSSLYNSGVIWVLIAALSWTIYAALQKKLVQKFHAQQMNMFIYGLPVLVLLPFVPFSELTHLNTISWVILVFLGINTVVAYGCLAESFKYIEANKVSIIITLNPIITFVVLSLFAVYNINWVEAEIITFKGMMGAGLVLFGAVLVVLPKKLINRQRA
jgi:drug/metabolite transporter (DMT)-like permease